MINDELKFINFFFFLLEYRILMYALLCDSLIFVVDLL